MTRSRTNRGRSSRPRAISRWALPLLAVALLALAVVGCGDSGDTDAGDGSTSASADASAQRCETITIADLDSPEVHASYYAIDEGIVKDDRIGDIEVSYQTIPQLVQNAGSDRYDLTSTSLTGVVLVREATGKDYRIVAMKQALLPGAAQLWTAAGSPIRSPEDIEGETLGVIGIGGTVTVAAQIVLAENYGLDAKVNGGDVNVTDLDPPTLLNALKKGQAAAGVLLHFSNWLATSDKELRVVVDLAKEFEESFDANIIGGSLIANPDTIEDKAGCLEALQEMLKASADYAHEHIAEIAPIVTKLEGGGPQVPPAYLEYWFDHNQYGNTLDAEWVGWADTFLQQANAHGLAPEPPKAIDLMFQP